MAYSSIVKPSVYFNTKLYAGNNGTNAITGVGFQPDFNWIKDRTSTGEHLLVDAVRGMYNIRSNSTAAESANGSIHQQSLDSDGFTVAGSAGNSNASGRNYASWNWKANGRSEEHTSELQSPCNLVCRLLLEKKKHKNKEFTQQAITQHSPR